MVRDTFSLIFAFNLTLLLCSLVQVASLLFAANHLVLWLWKMKVDPDNAAIPYLTAAGDLIGGALLALTFYLNDVLA